MCTHRHTHTRTQHTNIIHKTHVAHANTVVVLAKGSVLETRDADERLG